MDARSTYLVGVRRAHEYDRSFFWHFPAAPGMDLPEEELDQYGECPQKGIVDIFVHDGELLALCVSLFCCHLDCLYRSGDACGQD
jgi:hypothetical protein